MYNMFAVTQFTEETGAILLLMLAAAVSGFFTTSSGRVRGIAPLSLLSALVLACWLEGGRRASPSAPFSVGFDVVGFLLYELTIARVIWKTAGNIGELCILTVLVLSQVGYIFGIGGSESAATLGIVGFVALWSAIALHERHSEDRVSFALFVTSITLLLLGSIANFGSTPSGLWLLVLLILIFVPVVATFVPQKGTIGRKGKLNAS
jgi:hypothetical protein